MPAKPEIVFTFPACMGGVSSLNYNLINNSTVIREFHSRVILLKDEQDKQPDFLDTFNADETIVFRYSYYGNRTRTAARLAALLGKAPGAIVAENLLTIDAAAQFGCPKTLFHFLHDFGYVRTNIMAGDRVDAVVSHSTFFLDAAFSATPRLFADRCFYLPYGVRQLPALPEKASVGLRVVFLGRIVQSKGVLMLAAIDAMLRSRSIDVEWCIIGKGPLEEEVRAQWQGATNVQFRAPDTTEEVYSLLGQQDLLILPTSFDGTPVAIMEAIANGVVPVVSDLPGGIRDLVKPGFGTLVPHGNVVGFADAIARYASDRALLAAEQRACFVRANEEFDIRKNADNYFRLFLRYEEFRRSGRTVKRDNGLFDRPWMPEAVSRAVRRRIWPHYELRG